MTLLNITLKNKLEKLVKKDKTIDDIILFGSIIRGKEEPSDTDILVLFKDKVNKETEYALRHELEMFFPKVSIISKTLASVTDPAFDAREAVLFEGISLLNGKTILQRFGFSSLGLFKYSFERWNKLKKTKFYYALNGRMKSKGILSEVEGIKFSDGIILVPLKKIEKMKQFLESWDISYKYLPILLPERLNKKNILEAK